jgi:hypothetical protein
MEVGPPPFLVVRRSPCEKIKSSSSCNWTCSNLPCETCSAAAAAKGNKLLSRLVGLLPFPLPLSFRQVGEPGRPGGRGTRYPRGASQRPTPALGRPAPAAPVGYRLGPRCGGLLRKSLFSPVRLRAREANSFCGADQNQQQSAVDIFQCKSLQVDLCKQVDFIFARGGS